MKNFLAKLFFSDELENARQSGYREGWKDSCPESESDGCSKEFYDAKLRTEGFWRGFGAGYADCMKDKSELKQRFLDSTQLDEKNYKNKYDSGQGKISIETTPKTKSRYPSRKTATKKIAPSAKKAVKK